MGNHPTSQARYLLIGTALLLLACGPALPPSGGGEASQPANQPAGPKTMSMSTHPAYLAGWISDDQRKVRNVSSNNCTGAYECIAANCNAADDCCVGSNCAAALQPSDFV